VTDLQPGDFDVREGGLPRKVIRAGLANDPMRIALIVDSSETVGSAALNQFRAGLRNFYDALPAETEVALMTIGRQARMRVAPTSDRKKLNDSASGFFADGGGTAALDGVIEGYNRFLRKVEARWPVLVLITTDGPITGSVRDDELERFLRELQTAGIVAHSIVVSTRGSGTPTGVALSVSGSTGGSYEAIAAVTALPDKMKALGEKLAAQFHGASSLYRVEYLSETSGPRGVEVGIARSGVRLTISDRRGGK
jgi:Mg-chelatase subunit ChlD